MPSEEFKRLLERDFSKENAALMTFRRTEVEAADEGKESVDIGSWARRPGPLKGQLRQRRVRKGHRTSTKRGRAAARSRLRALGYGGQARVSPHGDSHAPPIAAPSITTSRHVRELVYGRGDGVPDSGG